MKRAKMIKTAAGPAGTLVKGDFAPPDMAEDLVKAKAAEWVDDPGDAPNYDSNSFGGQSVAAFTEILGKLALDVPRIIEPRRVAAAVVATIDDLNAKVAELEESLAAMVKASEEAAAEEAAKAAEEKAAGSVDKTAETDAGDEKKPAAKTTIKPTTRKTKDK